MNVINLDLNNIEKLEANTALLIGTFDGFHRGHQSLLSKAKSLTDDVAVLLIFTSKIRTKEHQKSGLLTTIDDRLNIFKNNMVRTVLLLNLGSELLSLSPLDFIGKIIKPLGPRYIIIGEDFRFGYKALGTPENLKQSDDVEQDTSIITPELYHREKISTSLIKEKLTNGEFEVATKLLGKPFSLTGFVTKGYGLGGKLGYPTANISLDPSLFLPRHGVHFVRVIIEGKKYFGMSSLGYHPTVNEVNFPLLEVNIFNFNADLYHKVLTVEFLVYLRPEEKFNSLDELIAKIAEDRQVCNKLIAKGEY